MTTPPPSPMRQRRNQLIVVAAVVLLLGTAVVQGLWSDRWGSQADVERAKARVEEAPLAAGPWRGVPRDMGVEQVEQANRVGIAGLVRREFTRTHDNQTVTAILMCGRFGPLSVHTPDVCYGSAGYVMMGKPVRVELKRDDGAEAFFWTARFHKPRHPEAPPLRIFWGWDAGDGWRAPGNPRWAFRMKPVLYKLYVVREMASENEPLESDPGLAFLKTWLPELQPTLFGEKR